MLKIGDKVMVSSDNDNEGYDDFRGKILIIINIARSMEENGWYDISMNGMGLCDLETEDGEEIMSSLYECELEEI